VLNPARTYRAYSSEGPDCPSLPARAAFYHTRERITVPDSLSGNIRAGVPALRPAAFLSRGWLSSRSPPDVLASYSVRRSHLAVRPPRGLRTPGALRLTGTRDSRRISPRPRVLPGFPRTVSGASALPRFPSPPAQPNRPSHHSRASNPGSCCVHARSSVPRRLAPETVSPVSFNRARSRGFTLQSLTRRGSRPSLDVASPLAIGLSARA
jgi:hypothetical protein